MLNHISVMGRLTATPELRRTASNLAVTSCTVAVERDFKNNGEKETDFIDIVAWKSTAEFICQHFAKGNMIVVDGRLQIRDWTDRQDNKRKSAEIVAASVYFGESKKEPASECASTGTYETSGAEFDELTDDSKLPF